MKRNIRRERAMFLISPNGVMCDAVLCMSSEHKFRSTSFVVQLIRFNQTHAVKPHIEYVPHTEIALSVSDV